MHDIEQITGRVRAIVTEAYSQCKGELSKDERLMIATSLWSLSSATYLSCAAMKGEFADSEPKEVLQKINDAFKSWLVYSHLIELSDDAERHATRFNDFTSAMIPKLTDVLRSRPNRAAPEMDMVEAAPELYAMIISDHEKGPWAFKAAIYAVYTVVEEFRQIASNFEGTDAEELPDYVFEPLPERLTVATKSTSVAELVRALVTEKCDPDTFGRMSLDDKRLFQMLAVLKFILKRNYAHGMNALIPAEKACRPTHIGTGWRQIGKTRSALVRAFVHLKLPRAARQETTQLIKAASVVVDQIVAKTS